MRSRAVLSCALAAAACAPGALAQSYLMIPNSTTDRIMLLSPVDGSLVNADFIVDTGATPFNFQTPKDAIQVGGEIWVSDQVTDAVFRFDLQGNYLSTIGGGPAGGLDNIRGMAFHDGVVYVTNAGSGNGATADSVSRFDAATGALLGVFTSPLMTDPFDLCPLGEGELLLADFTTNHILKYAVGTGEVSAWSGTTLPLAQQISPRAGGGFLVAAFSADSGIYELDAQGNTAAYHPGQAPRGVHQLTNGNIIWTGTQGVYIYDAATQASTLTMPLTGCQFIGLLTLGAPPCDANCDGSTAEPILNVNDFICFQTKFAAGCP